MATASCCVFARCEKVGSLSNLTDIEITGENAARLTFSAPDVYYWMNTSCMNILRLY